jgi:methionyl-tRNA formyltransferase
MVMKYEDIIKKKQLREKKELEKKATWGRRRKKQFKQIKLVQQKQISKRSKGSEKEAAICEMAESRFEEYCSVMEIQDSVELLPLSLHRLAYHSPS